MTLTPHVILPCAGFGQRFKDVGYSEDKPLIKVGGRRLIDWVLDCLPHSWMNRIVFVVREDQTKMADELSDLDEGPSKRVLALAGPTQGAACSVLAAAVGLPPDDPVLVANADQWFRVGTKHPVYVYTSPPQVGFVAASYSPDLVAIKDVFDAHCWAMDAGVDGLIFTFPGTGPAWSYAVTNGTNRVVHVIEKKQVSEHATVGVYWWRRAGDLVKSLCAMIAVGERTKNEFYLAPSFNFLPLSDKDVQIVPVEEFHGLGTPEQVQTFEKLLNSGWGS